MEELMEVLTMCEGLSKKMKRLELSGKIRMGMSEEYRIVYKSVDDFTDIFYVEIDIPPLKSKVMAETIKESLNAQERTT